MTFGICAPCCAARFLVHPNSFAALTEAAHQKEETIGIPVLVRFARLKEKRLDGLVVHVRHDISTGRLEGFNNKIREAKRVGYGYHNEDYCIRIAKYIRDTNPSNWCLIPVPTYREPSLKHGAGVLAEF